MELRQKLLEAFDSEYRSILECIRSHLLKFEQDDALSVDASAFEEVFRMAHTLKGAARVVDLGEVVAIAHRLETLFTAVRSGKVKLDKKAFRSIHAALDGIEDLVAASKRGNTAVTVDASSQVILSEIDELLGLKTGEFENSHLLKPIAKVATVQAPVQLVPEKSLAADKPLIETLRLNAEHLDRMLRTAGELMTSVQGNDRLMADLEGIERQSIDVEKEWEVLKKTSARPLQKLTETPELRKVASYIDFVEMKMRSLTKQVRQARQTSRQNAWSQNLLNGQLREEIQKARMVPVETVLEGFHKMVRDLAAEENKKVEFRALGLEVEADRLVLQALRSPLMHMLRNCVSHGLEAPDLRSSSAKDPIGRITLRLEALGGRLRIFLEDDGRGLDLPMIAETAVKSGLFSSDEISKRSSDELSQLIFRPGFSTAQEVTEVSGRGMGLSVVYETVKRLQGTVQVETGTGQGTRFIISVPLTVSNHRLLLVNCQDQCFGIPLYGVDHLKRVKLTDLKTIDGKSSIVLNEKPVQLCSLASLLRLPDHKVQPNDNWISIVVLRFGSESLAVAVDSIRDERESLIKDLGSPLNKQSHLLGVILLDDGSVSAVLDPAELIRSNLNGRVLAPLKFEKQRENAKEPKFRTKILVIDDSITTRTLEKGILEANGYEVGLAVDGADALTKLQLKSYDLIISDIEMPVMDGFMFLGELKKNPRFAKTPIIMVTSRESLKDQERGLNLGASAYIMKQKFDQAVLLEAIRKVI